MRVVRSWMMTNLFSSMTGEKLLSYLRHILWSSLLSKHTNSRHQQAGNNRPVHWTDFFLHTLTASCCFFSQLWGSQIRVLCWYVYSWKDFHRSRQIFQPFTTLWKAHHILLVIGGYESLCYCPSLKWLARSSSSIPSSEIGDDGRKISKENIFSPEGEKAS